MKFLSDVQTNKDNTWKVMITRLQLKVSLPFEKKIYVLFLLKDVLQCINKLFRNSALAVDSKFAFLGVL